MNELHGISAKKWKLYRSVKCRVENTISKLKDGFRKEEKRREWKRESQKNQRTRERE